MSVTLERLGRGAAYLLHDGATATTLLLGCGEAKEPLLDAASAGDAKTTGSADDGSGYDSVESADGAVSNANASLPRHVRRYAHELRSLMKRQGDAALTAVLIPDYRPEACLMVPFLTEKCAAPLAAPDSPPQPCPPILTTHGTRAIAPHHLTEYWTAHGKEKAPLYDAADIQSAFRKTQPVALKARITVNENLKITAYHSGHVAGGCAFFIELGATTILFAHDFNLGGGRVLLPAQIPRLEPSVLITRSSFAVTVSETKTNMERELMRVVHECVSAGGKVVIPVYRLGFFHELMTILLDYWRKMKFTFPIFVSDESMAYPSRFAPLLRRTYTDEFKESLAQRDAQPPSSTAPDIQVFDWKRLQSSGPFVLFTGPASIAHGDSLRAVKACAADPKNLIVLSENCTLGTVNYSLYADPQRKEVAKRLGVNVTCGVHYFPCGDEVDAKSIVELVAQVAPRSQVLLDYVVPEDMQFIKTHIHNRIKTSTTEGSGGDGSGVVVSISEIARDGEPTLIHSSREIPLKIHKSMFNNPFDVQGMLIAEGGKRKLMLVTAGNGARRLKKKRHSLNFAFSWKKTPEPSTRVKKKSSRAPSSALAFLLSAPAESTDDDEEPEALPQANIGDLLTALHGALSKWLHDFPIEKNGNRWLKVRSVAVSVSHEWEVHLEWSYEDEELAGRVLGIAKQVINAEHAKKTQQERS